jgi:hypothetical protein
LRALVIEQHLGAGDRILIQAHGQAGLVLALASNLLCPSPITGRKTFFDLLLAANPQGPDAQAIQRIDPLLTNGTLLNGVALDIVTFGTPVRYGWDPSGIGKLLHIVNHRNLRTDGKTWLSKMDLPQITVEMPIAWGGDYVQELAVAGSDALPAENAKAANKAVWELLEPYDGFERWVECAAAPDASRAKDSACWSITKTAPAQPTSATTTTATPPTPAPTRCSSTSIRSSGGCIHKPERYYPRPGLLISHSMSDALLLRR